MVGIDRARGAAKKGRAGQGKMRAVAAADKRERLIDALAILIASNQP